MDHRPPAPAVPVQTKEDASFNSEPNKDSHVDQLSAIRDASEADPEVLKVGEKIKGILGDGQSPVTDEQVKALERAREELDKALASAEHELLTIAEARVFIEDFQNRVTEMGQLIGSVFPKDLRAGFNALERLDEAYMWACAAANQFCTQEGE